MNPLISDNSELQQKLSIAQDGRSTVIGRFPEKETVDADLAVSRIMDRWASEDFGRIVVGIGGFPASGKTTLSKLIVDRVNEAAGKEVAGRIPMDGFHYPNHKLDALDLQKRKGDIDTYDVPLFASKLTAFRDTPDASIWVPDYIREIHDVVQDAIEIGRHIRVLITEGIYVGYTGGAWRTVRDAVDLLFYLDEAPEVCVERIIARNLKVGRGVEMIEGKLHNDFRFMEKSYDIIAEADFFVSPLPPLEPDGRHTS